jgi:hypothetical protein
VAANRSSRLEELSIGFRLDFVIGDGLRLDGHVDKVGFYLGYLRGIEIGIV